MANALDPASVGLPSLSGVRRLFTLLLHSPLLRNGYALIASAGVTSVLGLAFWALAARFYSPAQVGIGAALISTMLTLGNISQLNFGNLLNRYLPSAGSGALRLILAAYAIAGAAAVLLSSLAIVFISSFVSDLAFLRDEPLSAAGFVVATLAWTLFALQDSVLAGLRHAIVVPFKNSVLSAGKLVLLMLFAGSSLLGSGLFAAWVLPLPLLIAFVNWLIFFRFPQRQRPDETSALSWRTFARYFGWDYLGTLASMTTMGSAPLVVLHYGSAKDLAVYYISWEIAYSVYLISRSMGISLLAEAAFDEGRLRRLAIDATIYTLIPLTGVVALILTAAPLLLPMLGAQYAGASSAVLRLLALSCLPWGLVTLMLAIARVKGQTQVVAAAQVTTLFIVLGLGTPLVIAHEASGMAIAWLVAHCVTAVGLLAGLFRQLGPSGRTDLLLSLLSALANLWGKFAQDRPAKSRPVLETVVADFCALMEIDTPDPQTIREFGRESDVRTAVFKTSGADPKRLVFKSATSDAGSAALTRHIARSQELASDPALAGLNIAVSRVLASQSGPASVRLIEVALEGEDGRSILTAHECDPSALAEAMSMIGGMHRRTASRRVIDERWLARWIDQGSQLVASSRSLLMDISARAAALHIFCGGQRQFWGGLSLPLGLGHGDLCPGNLLFVRDTLEHKTRLSAIIDWETASWEAPPGLDEIFLLLTVRAQKSGQELGFVVRDFLADPVLTPLEQQAMPIFQSIACTAYGSLSRPVVLSTLAGLAWWRHIACNISKSTRFSDNALWVAINIDLVLAWYGGETLKAPSAPLRRWCGYARAPSSGRRADRLGT